MDDSSVPTRAGKIWLSIILLVAIGLRVGAAVALQIRLDRLPDQTFLIAGDAEGYWRLGQKLAAGEEYAIYDPPRRAMRMPGFPAVLAVANTITGETFLGVRVCLALIGAGACGLVYLLGARLFDRLTGLIAAAITAMTPSMVVFSVMILSETTFAAAVLFSLLLFAKLVQKPGPVRWRLALAVGAAMALAVYVRPSWLLAAPGFCLVMVLSACRKSSGDLKTALIHSALVLTALLAAMAPWAARNKFATGHWVMTTLWAGPSLYDGLNPDATGESDMAFFDRDQLMNQMSEFEMDQHYRQAALQFARENPGAAAKLAVIKLWRYFKPWPNAAQFGGFWAAAAIAVFYLPLLALLAIGFWAHRKRFWQWLIPLAPLFYFAAIHAVFVSSLRYRLPAEYPLCVLAAAGLLQTLKWRRSRNDRA